ncbi:hypothetical protein BC829DRAFT_389716 [Chytridium lagenaria]|nr:hypothetical protein BC829DRAFT_389716 [Chytridium lagenaria]
MTEGEGNDAIKQALSIQTTALIIPLTPPPSPKSSIASCVQSSADLASLSLVCKTFTPLVMTELWRTPVFQYHHGTLLWKLMLMSSASILEPTPGRMEETFDATDQSTQIESKSSASLYMPYFSLVRELDLRRLSRPPLDIPDPAPAWIAATRLALRLASFCPNLLSVKLFCIHSLPPSNTSCGPVSQFPTFTSYSRMAGRWPRLRTLRIGIVTPFMWGVRSILGAVEGPNTQAIGAALGGVRGTESFGFARLLQRCPRIEVLGIEPLPGDDGTAWLLEVLSLHAPPSLKKVELGRGRYLMSTQFSAKRVWRAFFEFLIRSQIQKAIVVDHFYSIRTASPGLWILTENYLNTVASSPGTATSSSPVAAITQAQQQAVILGDSNPFLQSLGVPSNDHQGRFGSVVVFGPRGLNVVRRLASEIGVEASRSLFFQSSQNSS